MFAARERETAFIDPSISDVASLVAGLRPEVDAIILNPKESAVTQIAAHLKSRPGAKTVHVIAHGREGEVSFQSGAVNLEALHEHAGDLAKIGNAIGDDGDILLWTCHTGQGICGSTFVEALAQATRVRVAASTGLVGSAARGGQWRLDARFGDRDIQVPLTAVGINAYPGVMHIHWNGSSSADAQSGTYGTSIALDPISTNDYTTVTISNIPVGATLSDGNGNSFTATSGHTSVNIASWTYTTSGSDHVWSTLTISNVPSDANFTLTATDSIGQTNTDVLTILPAAPTITLVTDDVSPVIGPLNSGDFTNDTALTVKVSLANTGAVANDTLQLYNGVSTVSTSRTLSATDISNGYYTFTTNTLSNGTTYNITAKLTNGSDSATSAAFTVHEDTLAPTEITPGSRQSDNWTTANPEGAGNVIFGSTHGNAITVADTGGSTILTVALSVGSGTFTLSGTSGISFISGGQGQSSMTFSGTASAINTALSNSTYHTTSTNTATGNTDDTLTITTTDQAGNVSTAHTVTFDCYCFFAGTKIRTPDGEVKVETLKRGDLVLTNDGRTMPVNWLGRQTVSTVFADKLRVLPIRIKAGALANNVPSQDLLLSPDHAVLVDGALVQAGALVNGTSIVRETNVPKVFVYYHVEVDDHSLILAENTPAETFIDNVDRMAYDNWAEHQALYPEGKSINELPYPRAKAHRQVPVATRVKLAERAQAIGATVGVAAA